MEENIEHLENHSRRLNIWITAVLERKSDWKQGGRKISIKPTKIFSEIKNLEFPGLKGHQFSRVHILTMWRKINILKYSTRKKRLAYKSKIEIASDFLIEAQKSEYNEAMPSKFWR